MPKKLKSALRALSLTFPRLLAKGAVFGLLLFWAARAGGFWPRFFFLAGAAFFYFRPLHDWRKFFYSFAALAVYSLILAGLLEGAVLQAGWAVFGGVVFTLVLGLKSFSFQRREEIFHYLAEIFYFLIAASFFALSRKSGSDFVLIAAVSLFFSRGLLKESLDFFFPDFPSRRKSLISFGGALIVFELLAAAALLPLGVINSAALVVLCLIVLEDLIAYHLKGNLSRQAILNSATALIVLALFIFLSEQVLKI